MITIEYTENFKDWYLFLTADSYEDALKQLVEYVNENDAIAGIMRIARID
ncbi:MAG: hypothetical protein V3T88_01715 [Nitrosomonadaceae bacterium]